MVTPEQHILFGPFSLDTVNECLWRGTEVVGLTPKMFAVLRYLLARPGQLVTKEELLGAVWSDTYVSDAALKVCIRRTREALNDNPKAPQFIETVQRRGYRFIGTVVSDQYPVANHQKKSNVTSPGSETRHHQSLIPNTQYPAPTLVGREAELTHLQHWLDKALGGERQVVFVTGEAGIGKTAVVESFLTRVGAGRDPSPRGDGLWVAWGECVEHYGAGEAYLPVLEALGRLCRHPRGARLFFLLNRYAPTWLAQMPWLVPEAEHGKLQQRIAGTTKERMLRELAELLEAVTAETPLIFVLEDLQWSDYSTLDCLAYLARRREPARLLLLGTYRPAEANEPGHPLEAIKQELLVHRYCQELPLPCLSEAAVAEYVRQRFRLSPASSPPAAAKDTAPPAAELHALAQIIHQRTDGNPLFLVNVLDYLVTHQAIAQANGRWVLQRDVKNIALGLPESLRQMMKKQVERLSHEDQRVLEAASVVGAEFTAAAVAAGVAQEVVQTEERCEDLARRAYFLQAHGAAEWPDGTVTARYRFIHNLYQDALYERVPAGKRAHLHRQIGERMEKGYGGQAHEVAAELAVHFERGREYGKAVRYLQQAAKNAIRRCGYREAVEHLNKGLTLLDTLPDTPERLRQEIAFNLLLGMSLIATKGYAAADVGAVYTRALALCGQGEETPQRYWALWGLQVFSLMRAELQRARELGEQLFQLAQRLQ
ncbi:MAG: AAA family ATPase, partial [Thermodesulfobacteriota bacterium]